MIRKIYIEVGPLLEEKHYTGIPNVVAHIIEELSRSKEDITFFHRTKIINGDLVAAAIKERTNEVFFKNPDLLCIGDLPSGGIINGTLGIITNSRYGLKRVFEKECQLVYDLTPLVTPQFHIPERISYHLEQYEKDFKIPDYFICISESTRNDLLGHLKYINEKKVFVSYLAGEVVDEETEQIYQNRYAAINVEPFILYIGTMEPRKNVGILFDLFRKYPEVLNQFKWVICGREGWLVDYNHYLEVIHELPMELKNRIVRYGYISELEKIVLLRKARFLVFPSLYEGFGLPVIEAMQEGCPVLASSSSSIPEAGGDVAEYFNPEDVDSLYEAYVRMKGAIEKNNDALRQRCMDHARKYSWRRFAMDIIESAERAAKEARSRQA